jgi:hypothetical protein
MIRLFVAAAIAATLCTSSLFAAEANKALAGGQSAGAVTQGPLSSGKPAGIRQAQDMDSTSWWVIGLGAAAIGGVIALTSDDKGGSMPPAQPVATST